MESVLPSYILYFTYSENFQNQFSDAITGIIGGVSLSKIKNFDISIPPLSEQHRIVAILDEAFAGIASAVESAEKNLANARELFVGFLNSSFSQEEEGWVEKQLDDVCCRKFVHRYEQPCRCNERIVSRPVRCSAIGELRGCIWKPHPPTPCDGHS
jgi:hypothetical protein